MKHLVLVGGGHAHMTVMKNLGDIVERGHKVTLLNADPYHYYSGMGPGMLGGTYKPEEIRFHVRKMVEDRGGAFVHGRLKTIDPAGRLLYLENGDSIGYDAVSFNVGSEIPRRGIALEPGGDLFTVKPIVNLLGARNKIRELTSGGIAVRILVIGGGPAGLELSGNAWRAVDRAGGHPSITVVAGKEFLSGVPRSVIQRVKTSFRKRGIAVIEGARVARCGDGTAELADGKTLSYDVAFLATGVQPPSLFKDSGLPVGPDGGLLVNSQLQCTDFPEIFGGGDCISFEPHPLDKVGVFAVRQNPVLAHNLLAALEQRPLIPLTDTRPYLLIFNLGDDTGIFWKGGLVFNGKLAFRIKDYIDRRFMREFQVSGERQRI